MKKQILFFILGFISALVIYSFKTADKNAEEENQLFVALDKMNVLYVGIENPITICLPGVDESKMKLSISQGRLVYSNGKYSAVPTTVGRANIVATVANDDNTITEYKSQEFRVKSLPNPVAKLGKGAYENGGLIQTGTFKAQSGIYAVLEGFDFDY